MHHTACWSSIARATHVASRRHSVLCIKANCLKDSSNYRVGHFLKQNHDTVEDKRSNLQTVSSTTMVEVHNILLHSSEDNVKDKTFSDLCLSFEMYTKSIHHWILRTEEL